MKRILLCMFAIFAAVSSYAEGYFVTIDGLKFMADTHAKTATLVANNYSGDIKVPASFTDKGVEYKVTSLIASCFEGCSNLTSVTLPSTITSLGDNCFKKCFHLKSVNIPSSVTSIGSNCFSLCMDLVSIDIPSSVTSIGEWGFSYCSNLKSIVIPSSVTDISDWCFSDCSSLTNITIPSSVKSIGNESFWSCSSLTTLTIPQSVTSLGYSCFGKCNNLASVICQAQTPPSASNAFTDFNTSNCILNVPDVDAYKSADGWKNFKYIFKLDASELPTEGTTQCEKPTISFVDGQLQFSSATSGAQYHYTLTTPDDRDDALDEDGKVDLSAYYDISAYASADGYKVSDKATARLYWVKSNGSLDTSTGIQAKSMRGIVVSSDDGFVRVSGLNENETVTFYAVDGKMLAKMRAQNGSVGFATSANVVLCKVGEKTIKVSVR